MQEAQARYDQRDVAEATQLYRRAADLDPLAAEPWSRLAHIDFQRRHYGYAIVYAHEALRREPLDSSTQSLLTVSGLRAAGDALEQLRSEADENGPAHTEALNLAARMRDVLGQDALVPPAPRRKAKSRVRRRPSKPAAVIDGGHPDAGPLPVPANPFQALPGAGG